MIEKPIILVDMDDTINHFSKSFWQLHEELFDEKVDPESVTDWDLGLFSKRKEKTYDLFYHPGLFRYLEPKPYAQEFMQQLNEKYNVYFVTDAPSGTSFEEKDKEFSNPVADKKRWVGEHFPFFDISKIIFCSHKWMIHGDILIDDKPDTFYKFQELNRNIILMDASHNRSIDTPFRAHDLREAEKLINQILNTT